MSNLGECEMIISITVGSETQSKLLKNVRTREEAEGILKCLYEDDYLGGIYTLWVDGVEVLTLGDD